MTDRTRLLLLIPALALLALMALLFITFAATDEASASCTYSGSGDWTVLNGETCSVSGAVAPITGNLQVQTGGSLTLTGATLQMSSSYDGERTIEVQNGATLKVLSSTTVTAANTNFQYKFLVRPGATVEIKDSTVSQCGYGGSDDALGPRIESSAVSIQRSSFQNNYAGIYIKDASPKVDNSSFIYAKQGILIAGSTAKPTIYDCTVTINDYGIMSTSASSPEIGYSRIYDNRYVGLYFAGSNGKAFDNEVYDHGEAGAYIQSAAPNLTGNHIHHNTDGIRSYFGAPLIRNNELFNNSVYTVYLYKSAGLVEGNHLEGPSAYQPGALGYGIYMSGSKTTIKANALHFYNNTDIGVLTGSNAVIVDNSIDYFMYGMRVASSTVRIENNTIDHMMELYATGISISGSSGSIKNNTFMHGRYGMYLSFVDESLKVEGNTFKECGRVAMQLYEANLIIEGNTFQSNWRGINISNSRPYVIGNTFIDNFEGINVNLYTDAYIANNTFSLGNYSIMLWQGRATLVNNTISFSFNFSVWLQLESYVRMIDNHINGNYQKGVYIQNSEAWLTNNTFTSSGTGVYSDNSTLTMEYNNFTKDEVGIFVMGGTKLNSIGENITKCSQRGIFAFDSEIYALDLYSYKNEIGIYAERTNLTLIGAEFIDNPTAFSFYQSHATFIRGVRISGSTGETLKFYQTPTNPTADPVRLEQLTIFNNTGQFLINTSRLTISELEMFDNEAGIEASESVVSIKGSTIESNNATAVWAVTSTVNIEKTTVSDNVLGVNSYASMLNIVNCIIQDHNETGIQVEYSKLTLKDSRIVLNKDGIVEFGGSSFDILNCNISSNSVFGLYTDGTTTHLLLNYTRKIINKDNTFQLNGKLVVSEGGQVYFIRTNMKFVSPTAGASGATVLDGGILIMRENVVASSDPALGYYFRAESGSSIELANVSLRHCGRGMASLGAGLEVRTGQARLNDLFLEDNEVGLYVMSANIQAYRIRFNANEVGLKVQDGEILLEGSVINDSAVKDIVLTRSLAKLLDTRMTFNKCEVQDQNSLLIVMWYLKVSVLWDDGQPVNGALVTVTDLGGQKYTMMTDPQGITTRVAVKEYQQKGPDPTGYILLTPEKITAKVNALTVETSQYMSTSMTVKITMLDDKAPIVTVTNPKAGEILYNGKVLFIGTAMDEGSSVVAVELSVDGKNWFLANGTTSWSGFMTLSNGNHVIQIKATDARGNSGITAFPVEVDLVNPLLRITSPQDGLITNVTSIEVRGKVHQGASLLINGKNVAVEPSGNFSVMVDLVEGENIIKAKAFSKDGLEDMEVAVIVIRDTVAPQITLVNPKAGALVNISALTVTVSANEEVSFYINGASVPTFAGKADAIVVLEEGRNTITVRAVDRAGNPQVLVFNVTLDITKPDLVLIKPTLVAFSTGNERVSFLGHTEPGANLTLNGKPVPLDVDGTFKLKKKLSLGKNTLTLMAKDKAGNTNTIVLEIKRKQVVDPVPYIILLVVLVAVACGADYATMLYYKKYYKPKGPTSKAAEGGATEEESEEKELMDDLEGEEGWERPKQPPRREPSRPPPQRPPPAEGETEFEEVEDLGQF